MADPADLTRKLAAVQDRLLQLPDDAFAERWELRRQQDELRAQAGTFAETLAAQATDEDLLAELGGLRAQMKMIEKQRIDLVQQSGSGGATTSEMSSLGGVKLNKGIDDAMGLPKIKARIGVIKGILIDREVDIPPPD